MYHVLVNSASIHTLLKERGLRVTKSRKAILSILSDSKEPLNVKTLQTKFQRRSQIPHLTTIYRDLDTFESTSVVESCNVFGSKKYQLKSDVKIAHCISCNSTTPLPNNLAKGIDLIQKDINFLMKLETHLHGFCKNCQKTS